MEKKYFGYIRVSTAKQGEKGVSLQEQKGAIQQYAQRYGLTIAEWFEERESAAKRGRPVFTQMIKELRRGKVRGLIIHKIDRSARNLKDWSDLGELIDAGIDVHFANESLDLNTRGGRLSADIQAVVASDYIRNLREETKKGFYGASSKAFIPFPRRLATWIVARLERKNWIHNALRLLLDSSRCMERGNIHSIVSWMRAMPAVSAIGMAGTSRSQV